MSEPFAAVVSESPFRKKKLYRNIPVSPRERSPAHCAAPRGKGSLAGGAAFPVFHASTPNRTTAAPANLSSATENGGASRTAHFPATKVPPQKNAVAESFRTVRAGVRIGIV